jgi:imidazolonepropionase-like amidohydrolase
MRDRPEDDVHSDPHAPPGIGRRRFLAASALTATALWAGDREVLGGSSVGPSPSPSPSPSPGAARRILFRHAALTDARSARLDLERSVLVEAGRIAWIRPSDDEGPTGPRAGLEVVDASGATIVPGLVDGHGHMTMPGGARWIERGLDPAERQLAVAEANAGLATGAGVRWVRDVGSPRGVDPATGRERALSLVARDRWATRTDLPYLRAAGTWLTRVGTLPAGLAIEVGDADALVRAAERQLDEGADLVKLYLDGPDPTVAPWSPDEIRRVVRVAHDRGARVTAHAGRLDGARSAVLGGVDAIEHGFELDADVAAEMARRGTFLVTTLAVMRSWLTFRHTTRDDRFTAPDRIRAIRERLEGAEASVRAARAAGVAIAAGTDFGGGSLRANQLAWEVETLVEAGLEPWQALAAATWRGGDLLGEPDAGRLREGGPADLFLVHGDPLNEPRALWRVWRVAWRP